MKDSFEKSFCVIKAYFEDDDLEKSYGYVRMGSFTDCPLDATFFANCDKALEKIKEINLTNFEIIQYSQVSRKSVRKPDLVIKDIEESSCSEKPNN